MEKKNDLRVQKTYRALMAAFEALMAEETFDDITVNELCARALIRRPTFFSHLCWTMPESPSCKRTASQS